MSVGRRSAALAFVALAAAALPAAAQVRVQCESRNYTYQFCSVDGGVEAISLVEQRSRAACVQGNSWGWDRRGVWVDRGCEAVFDARIMPPPPAPPPPTGAMVSCESRNYQQEFCPLPNGVVQVLLATQRSQAPCIEGRTWGWRANAIWVNAGCDADFQVRMAHAAPPPPAPPSAGLLYCESREYAYSFCPTGRLRSAQLVNQHSQAPCVAGQSWGYQNDGIWVDRGCAAEFSVQR